MWFADSLQTLSTNIEKYSINNILEPLTPQVKPESIPLTWKQAVQSERFVVHMIAAALVFAAILFTFPFFFQTIEMRQGIVLQDFVVGRIVPGDVSVPIFICIWGITLLTALRCVKDPNMFLVGLYGFVVLTLMRMATISLLPLNPPQGLIPLIDPISNFFYGKTHFVTKDLFFSGHTSSQFLLFLCLRKKWDKTLALVSSILVGAMVLIQHVHYTIDVVAAFPLTYVCYRVGKTMASGGLKKNNA
ncbi:MAG: phosphatase PAP2-related protein [Edaphocola sp.]